MHTLASRFVAVLVAMVLALGLGVASAAATSTGGSGGALSNRLNQSFTANGITSSYHIFAAGLDWSRPVGLLLYTDGSGGYGLDNPNATYLLDADGSAGLVAVAKKHNMLLLTPIAPSPDCDGTDNCWYNTTGTPAAPAKADWARALVDHVYGQYQIDKTRVAIGGYSSGAQFTSRWFVPRHGAAVQEDGVLVPIAYGGAPAVAHTFTPAYKANVVGHWNTGTSDAAYSTASHGAMGGHDWYRSNGFTTTSEWPAGVGHGRSGEFAGIMDRQIAAHVAPATSKATTTPAPAPGCETVYSGGGWIGYCTDPDPVTPVETVQRIAGADRYQTSAMLSQVSFEPGVPVVYIANGVTLVDALGAGAAAQGAGPVLPVPATGTLPASIAAELARLDPASIVIVGAPASVSESMAAQVRDAAAR